MINNEITILIDRYCAAWRESDVSTRNEILEAVWHEQGRYSDPTAEVIGRKGLSDLISETQARFPGGQVVRLSPVDAHHDSFRFTWTMRLGGNKELPESIDFGRIAEDGRISEITGFFGLIGGSLGGE